MLRKVSLFSQLFSSLCRALPRLHCCVCSMPCCAQTLCAACLAVHRIGVQHVLLRTKSIHVQHVLLCIESVCSMSCCAQNLCAACLAVHRICVYHVLLCTESVCIMSCCAQSLCALCSMSCCAQNPCATCLVAQRICVHLNPVFSHYDLKVPDPVQN